MKVVCIERASIGCCWSLNELGISCWQKMRNVVVSTSVIVYLDIILIHKATEFYFNSLNNDCAVVWLF